NRTYVFTYDAPKLEPKKRVLVGYKELHESLDEYVSDRLPGSIPADDPATPLLVLLRIFESINRNWNILSEEPANGNTLINKEEFFNQQLTSKLIYQLQTDQALILCCKGVFPNWLNDLTCTCKFLFP